MERGVSAGHTVWWPGESQRECASTSCSELRILRRGTVGSERIKVKTRLGLSFDWEVFFPRLAPCLDPLADVSSHTTKGWGACGKQCGMHFGMVQIGVLI